MHSPDAQPADASRSTASDSRERRQAEPAPAREPVVQATPADGSGPAAPTDDAPDDARNDALSRARAERDQAADETSALASLWRVPEYDHLAMIVAVREAQAAGLDDAAIAACIEAIWPTLQQMSGSDYFALGPRRDARLIERYLRDDRVEDAVSLIAEMSPLRGWMSVAGMVLLSAATLVFWLLLR